MRFGIVYVFFVLFQKDDGPVLSVPRFVHSHLSDGLFGQPEIGKVFGCDGIWPNVRQSLRKVWIWIFLEVLRAHSFPARSGLQSMTKLTNDCQNNYLVN